MESQIFDESHNYLQVKFYKGKVALGHSKKAVCLVIKKKQEQSISPEHQKINFASTLVRNIGEYLKQYPEHHNMKFELLHTHSRYEEHIMASLTGNPCTWERK